MAENVYTGVNLRHIAEHSRSDTIFEESVQVLLERTARIGSLFLP